MTLKFARFIEYSVPILALCSGWMARDLWGTVDFALAFRQYKKRAVFGMVLICLFCGAGHTWTVAGVYDAHKNVDTPRFSGAAQWMAKNIPAGETVANIWWEDFPDLYYSAHRQNFIWGLDPTYSLRYDPENALILEDMRCHRKLLNPLWLKDVLKTRLIIMCHATALQYSELTTMGWKPVYLDNTAVIFALEGKYGPPEEFIRMCGGR
jgi:hypothetical protein